MLSLAEKSRPTPPEEKPEEELRTLFAKVTLEEQTTLQQLDQLVGSIEADLQRLREAHAKADRDLTQLASRRQRNTANAAARALGEAPPLPETPAEPVLDRVELQDRVEGLAARIKTGELDHARALGRYRDEIHAVVYRCALRVAEDYAAMSQALSRLWALIAACQAFFAGPPRKHLVGDVAWEKFNLPGSEALGPLAKCSHEVWGMPTVASGESIRQAGVPNRLLSDFVDDFKREVGRWPFGR